MRPDARTLLDGWIGLARRSLAVHPELRRDVAPFLRRRLTETLCRARVSGAVHGLWRGGRLRAVVAAHPEADAWYGMRRDTIVIGREPGDDGALPWIVERVGAVGITADTDIRIGASDRALIDPLLRAQPTLGVEMVLTIGHTDAALAALVRHRDPPPLSALGLSAGPVADVGEIDRLVALTRALFAQHPEWPWFVSGERYLARKMAALMLNLHGADAAERSQIIRRDGEPLGVVRITVSDDPRWGRWATLGLLLDPQLWGRGVAKAVYRHALERLVADGIPLIQGATSQGSIMHLGRLMQRRLLGVHLRAGAHWPRAHFDPYLGPAP